MRLKKFALRGMIGLAVAIALCLIFSGTIRTLTTAKVRYAPVKMGKFESVTEMTGAVAFPEKEDMTLDVPEGLTLTVTRVYASAGQKVKKGAKLFGLAVTDAEKTLASLQQELDTAQAALSSWDRKNGSIRLSRNETLWMEAWEAARTAEKEERAARLAVLALLDPEAKGVMPESLPEKAGKDLKAAWETWEKAKGEADKARTKQAGLDRYAVADDTWTLLKQREENQKKRDDAEAQMMQIMLLSRQVETVTAPHAGYVISVAVEKGGILSGDEAALCAITPEKSGPVIRTDVSGIKQNIQKGTVIQIDSNSWGRVETKVIATGVSSTGHPYADAEITDDVIWSLGEISSILKEEIKLRIVSRAQESTCLVPAAAVRGSGDGRYVYVGETETSALAGSRITVRKTPVTVLGESGGTVSVAEDLARSKVLYMEDRAIDEGASVMLYEE